MAGCCVAQAISLVQGTAALKGLHTHFATLPVMDKLIDAGADPLSNEVLEEFVRQVAATTYVHVES